MSLSPETILHKGDRVRFVTYEEACEICGMPDCQYGSVKTFAFPEYGRDSGGKTWTLSIRESFIKEYGGTVVTIGNTAWDFGGAHRHYNYTGDCSEYGPDIVCPSMFSGYEDEEASVGVPAEQPLVEDLFGFLFN